MKTYAEKRFFEWHDDELAVSLRAKSGSYGGGSEVLVVDTLVFDESQITSKFNYSHPIWGGQCHPLTREAGRAIVIIRTAEDELSERDRMPESGSAPWLV